MRVKYMDPFNVIHTIPAKFHNYYETTRRQLEIKPLLDLEYLDILELWYKVGYMPTRTIHTFGLSAPFKGIAVYKQNTKDKKTSTKVAVFGSPTTDFFTLPYAEFRKLRLSKVEKLEIDRLFFEFFKLGRYHWVE